VTDVWFSLKLSLAVAGAATFFVTIIGTSLGYWLAKSRFWGKELVDAVFTLPLVLPPTVVGFYLLALLGKRGITHWDILFTPSAAVIAATVMALPLMVKSARAAIAGVPVVYEQAAYVLGKSPWQTFWQVTLPLASRGLWAGVILSFARALGEFGATLMVAGNIPQKTQTMPLAIYEATQSGDDNLALFLVLLMTATSLTILWVTNRLTQGRLW
jgi:molybdate transport system permease protein